uniref:cell growth regulator with RING finger domain protein 1-like n=1 Tax=Myxine glutinosa TaxID=7769 RepID=UPI00358F0098
MEEVDDDWKLHTILFVHAVVVLILVLSACRSWFHLPEFQNNGQSDHNAITTMQETPMVKVRNPLFLDLTSASSAGILGGVLLKVRCLENTLLNCYWGCEIFRVHSALLGCSFRDSTIFEKAIEQSFLHKQQFTLAKGNTEIHRVNLPEALEVTDFGESPRQRYPLVALVTSENSQNLDSCAIVSLLSIIHVPDRHMKLSCRILHRYLLTQSGRIYYLQGLFKSTSNVVSGRDEVEEEEVQPANGDEEALSDDPIVMRENKVQNRSPRLEREMEANDSSTNAEGEALCVDSEDSLCNGLEPKDCVVCQGAPVTMVLLPCRHACLCRACVHLVQRCPMCRDPFCKMFVLET